MNISYGLNVIGFKTEMSCGTRIFFLFKFIFYFFYYRKYILNKRKLSPIFNLDISASCGSIWQLTVNLHSAVVLIPDVTLLQNHVILRWRFTLTICENNCYLVFSKAFLNIPKIPYGLYYKIYFSTY